MDLLPTVVPRDVTLLTQLRGALQRNRLGTQAMQPDHRDGGFLRIVPDVLIMHFMDLLGHICDPEDMRRAESPRQSQAR
jgi:hypothetical protein